MKEKVEVPLFSEIKTSIRAFKKEHSDSQGYKHWDEGVGYK